MSVLFGGDYMKWFIPKIETTELNPFDICEYFDCSETHDCSNCIFDTVDKFNEFKIEIESKND